MTEQDSMAAANDAAIAQALTQAMRPRLMDNGWVTDDTDNTLAEYIIMMIVQNKTKEQMNSELGTEVLGVGEDDPAVGEFTSWLMETVTRVKAEINGENLPQNNQDGQPPAGEQAQDAEMNGDAPAQPQAPSGPRAMRNGTRGRGGRMIGQVNRLLDRSNDLSRIRGAANGQSGRIGRPSREVRKPNEFRPRADPARAAMSPEQQQQFMQQMMELQGQMFAQIMGGNVPQYNSRGRGSGRSLEDRIQRGGRRGGAARQNGRNDDSGMEVDGESTNGESFDTLCRFNDKCLNPSCGYAHQSPAADPGMSVALEDTCSFGAACQNRRCAARHPSPAQRQQHMQEIDCKFYPGCTNSACPFKHPDMPPCRNGADCTVANCKFFHSKTKCRYNPCLNPKCIYQHNEGQKRGAFEDKVWTRDGLPEGGEAAANGTSTRFEGLTQNAGQEELIIPQQEKSQPHAEGMNGVTEQPAMQARTADVIT